MEDGEFLKESKHSYQERKAQLANCEVILRSLVQKQLSFALVAKDIHFNHTRLSREECSHSLDLAETGGKEPEVAGVGGNGPAQSKDSKFLTRKKSQYNGRYRSTTSKCIKWALKEFEREGLFQEV